MADAFVLDTSAILALTGNEPGATEVQARLAEAIDGRIQLHSSFGDAFVAATARRFDATLIHKDPEFQALAGVVKQQMLPPKSGAPGS